jgi:hypothetical protein
MSTRVLATSKAVSAAQQMARLLDGQIHAQLQALTEAGRQLSSPSVWDGPTAVQFRTQQWPQASRSLDGALRALQNLQHASEKVVEDIVKAGTDGTVGTTGSSGPGSPPTSTASPADVAAVTSLSKDQVRLSSDVYNIAYKTENAYTFNAIGGYVHGVQDLAAAKARYHDYSSKAIPELQHIIDTTTDPALKVKAQNLLSIIRAQQKALDAVDTNALLDHPDPNVLRQVSAQTAVLTALGGVVTTSITKGGTVGEQFDDKGGVTIFYRGTTYGSASEVVENQALDVDRIMANQRLFPPASGPGVYITSQKSTADYYANLAGGGGRGLGPGTIRIELPPDEFNAFVARTGIPVEAPVPQPPTEGQTETIIPFDNAEEFDAMATYFLEEEE